MMQRAMAIAEAARHAQVEKRASLCAEALELPPSTWREEALRVLLAAALESGQGELVNVIEPLLPFLTVKEERLVRQAMTDPIGALTDPAVAHFSSAAIQRLMRIASAQLGSTTDAVTRDALACALHQSLEHLPPAVRLVEAVGLAQYYTASELVDPLHIIALAELETVSPSGRADLLRTVGAALAVHGLLRESAAYNAHAAELTAAWESAETERLRHAMRRWIAP